MIDLHLHLDGSLRPETVLELGEIQNITLPAKSLETFIPFLRVPQGCQSLNEYLERFDLPLLVLQTESALERVTFELVEDLAHLNVEYAEIRFAPQLHQKNGLTQIQVVKAAICGLNRALEKYKRIKAGLILCCMRGDLNQVENLETVEVAKEFLGQGVCAIDLAGAEALYPTQNFGDVFTLARGYHIPFTIHAGEAAGPESVWCALEYGAKRIGHGIHAIKDEALIQTILREGVTLEICVISNIQSKSVADAFSHPIRQLFDKGVRVTVNTDNRTVSNTSLEKEYAFLQQNYHFTLKELEKMERYAREAAFMKF